MDYLEYAMGYKKVYIPYGTNGKTSTTFGRADVLVTCEGIDVTDKYEHVSDANKFVNKILENYKDGYIITHKNNFYDHVAKRQVKDRIIVTTTKRPKEVLRIVIYY